jgi:hypothetical protein
MAMTSTRQMPLMMTGAMMTTQMMTTQMMMTTTATMIMSLR